MAIETVGDVQAILQLLVIYRDSHNGKPLGVGELWKLIVHFMLTDPEGAKFFSSYRRNRELDEKKPAPEYLGAFSELLEEEFVSLKDGIVILRPTGVALARTRKLPKSLKPLEMLVRHAHLGCIRIISRPEGEAPSSVRDAWIGLTLPAQHLTDVITLSVLTLQPKLEGAQGYGVSWENAMAALKAHNEEAWCWWCSNVFPMPLVFDLKCCEFIPPK